MEVGRCRLVGSGVDGLVVGTMWVCGNGWVLAGGKCVSEWVGGLVVSTMWVRGSG